LAQAVNALNASTTVEAEKNTEQISEMIHYAYHEAKQEASYLVNTQKMGFTLNPPSNSGVTTLSEFENFITELLWYCKGYQLLVDGLDHLRIQIPGLMLTSDAGEWFNQMVDTNDPQSEIWDFKSIVLTMKEQFVHQPSAQDAAQQYDE
jgi:hypothetical protein